MIKSINKILTDDAHRDYWLRYGNCSEHLYFSSIIYLTICHKALMLLPREVANGYLIVRSDSFGLLLLASVLRNKRTCIQYIYQTETEKETEISRFVISFFNWYE